MTIEFVEKGMYEFKYVSFDLYSLFELHCGKAFKNRMLVSELENENTRYLFYFNNLSLEGVILYWIYQNENTRVIKLKKNIQYLSKNK